MTCDQPVTFYKEKKHTKKEMDAIAAEWEANHKIKKDEGQKISLNDIFNGKSFKQE